MTALRPLLPVLLLGLFVLAALAVWVPRGSAPEVAAAPALKELDARLSSGSERLSALIAPTNERPVFHASRRPIAAPEAPKAPEATLTLLGVIDDGDAPLAFLKLSTTGALYRIGKGGTVGRWRVLDIGVNEVSISKDGNAPFTLRIGG